MDIMSADDWAYAALGLPVGSSISDVSRAFRRISLRLHPDKAHLQSRGQSDLDFKLVSDAYARLKARGGASRDRDCWDAVVRASAFYKGGRSVVQLHRRSICEPCDSFVVCIVCGGMSSTTATQCTACGGVARFRLNGRRRPCRRCGGEGYVDLCGVETTVDVPAGFENGTLVVSTCGLQVRLVRPALDVILEDGGNFRVVLDVPLEDVLCGLFRKLSLFDGGCELVIDARKYVDPTRDIVFNDKGLPRSPGAAERGDAVVSLNVVYPDHQDPSCAFVRFHDVLAAMLKIKKSIAEQPDRPSGTFS